MARIREFDIDRAVEQAMLLFWRQGYEATSLHDLTTALDIGKGSFYAAFGSKDALYAMSLGRYCSTHAAALVALLEEPGDVRRQLRTVLRTLVDSDAADPERGCLLVGSALERSSDEATVKTVSRTMNLIESALTGTLERARATGQLAAGKDPVALARFLTTFIQGVRVMGTARSDAAVLDDAVEVALATLD